MSSLQRHLGSDIFNNYEFRNYEIIIKLKFVRYQATNSAGTLNKSFLNFLCSIIQLNKTQKVVYNIDLFGLYLFKGRRNQIGNRQHNHFVADFNISAIFSCVSCVQRNIVAHLTISSCQFLTEAAQLSVDFNTHENNVRHPTPKLRMTQ